jgi:hypothetical protein
MTRSTNVKIANRRTRHLRHNECRVLANQINRVFHTIRVPIKRDPLHYIARGADMALELAAHEWQGHPIMDDGVITPEEAMQVLYGGTA